LSHVTCRGEPLRTHVAEVTGNRLTSMFGDYRLEYFLDASEGSLPGHLLPILAHPHQRAADAIGVVMGLTQIGSLGTNMSQAPHIVWVRSDADDALVLDRDLDAAHALAEGANMRMAGARIHDLRTSTPSQRPIVRDPGSIRAAAD
jgi:hypothetical protein